MTYAIRNLTRLVTVPVLEESILSDRPEVMTVLLKCDLHYRIVVGEYGFVAISEI